MIEAEAQTSVSSEGVTMSTLAEKLRLRREATQSTPTPVVVVPEVVEPVVESVVVVPEVVAPAPEPVVVEPVVATVIPPDAPGGDLVPERSEGIMATLAKRRATKAKPTEAKAEVQPVVVLPEKDRFTAIAEAAGLVSQPVVTPPVKVEYVNAPPVVEQPTPPATAELTLFVDCFPEKAPFDTLRALEDEIAARTPSLLEHLRKTSPKDVPEGTVDLGEVLFGRGYSTLSASFAVRPITGAWTVSTLGPASSKVLEVLLPKATFVVRGRR
jgi:hypothetical protein